MAQRKQEVIVHCEFANNGEEVRDILFEIFRAFVYRKTCKNELFRQKTNDLV